MSWASRAAANLMPLSVEKDDLGTALTEWEYTGHYEDLGVPSADCELCTHPDIRYQFEIGNRFTHCKLLVGSECITRFGISSIDGEGRVLDAEQTGKLVARDRRKLIEAARKRRVVSNLVELANRDIKFNILSFIEYISIRGAFTPNQMLLLIWRFGEHNVNYNIRDFKITIRRGREKQQLRDAKPWQIEQLSPLLSPAQKKFLDSKINEPTG